MADIYKFIEEYAPTTLFHIPYWLAQTAIGEESGDIASIFECDFSDYDSGFANAGGDRVIEVLLANFEPDEIIKRLDAVAMPDIKRYFDTAELMTKAEIPEIAEEVTRKWHETLAVAFPEIAGEIGSSFGDSTDAVTKYLKFQYVYSDEHENGGPSALTA
jgi:hypothetical protein